MFPAIEFFHPNVCHVCKITSREVKLKKCKQCRMISYCGPQHQKKHWTKHKIFCKVLNSVQGLEKLKSLAKSSQLRLKYRSTTMLLCELKLGRPLDAVEMNMIYFQKMCSFCDANENLQDCQSCLSNSLCSNHLNKMDEHNIDCSSLQLFFEAHLHKSNDYSYPDYTFRQEISDKYTDMDSFLQKNVFMDSLSGPLAGAMVSELITRPLTVLYALSILNIPPADTLSIHIIGSDSFEAATASHWKLIQKMRPSMGSLRLNFIGPEIESTQVFEIEEEMFSVRCSTELYSKFSAASDSAPSVIVAFNCGLHEFDKSDPNDTWGPSLSAILSRKVPIFLTSFTVSEASLDVARLRDLEPRLRVQQFSNPFACLTPLRDFEGLGVYLINSVLSILTHS